MLAPIRLGRVDREQSTASEYLPRICGGATSGQTVLKSVATFTVRTFRRYLACAWSWLYCDGPFLEGPDTRDAVVRLPEHDLAQQADRDQQQGCADERDQQLRPNVDRQARDELDERVADPSPPLPGGPRLLLLDQDLRLPRRSSRRPCS